MDRQAGRHGGQGACRSQAADAGEVRVAAEGRSRRAGRLPLGAEEEVAPPTDGLERSRALADREGQMRDRGFFAVLVLTWALGLTLSARAPQAKPPAAAPPPAA